MRQNHYRAPVRAIAAASAVGLLTSLTIVISSTSASATAAADGAVDATYTTNIGGVTSVAGGLDDVLTSATQSDGKVLIGGFFTTVGTYTYPTDTAVYPGAPPNTPLQGGELARLNADGTLDQAFSTNLGAGFNDGSVRAIAVQPNGQILVGGLFSQVNGVPANHLARLNADGTLDTNFISSLGTGFNGGSVRAISVQSNGAIVIGGLFTDINGTPSNHLARVTFDGVPDTAFTGRLGTGFDGTVDAIAQDAGGNLLVGGGFSTIDGAGGAALARLGGNGTPDVTFGGADIASATPTTEVYSIVVQSSGKIVIGGHFDTIDTVASKGLARLNSDGSLDTAFSAATGSGFADPNNAYSWVHCIAQESDGTLLVSGDFTDVNGVASGPVAHLSADGQILTGFSGTGFAQTTQFVTLSVNTVTVKTDGNAFVGGTFTAIGSDPAANAAALIIDHKPVITSVSPSSTSTVGSTGTVTITGSNFTRATAVTFGGTSSTFSVTNDTTIVANVPVRGPGTVDVAVTNGVGTTVKTGAFSYVDSTAPVVSLTGPTSVFAISQAIALSWSATDAGGSGLTGHYAVLDGYGSAVSGSLVSEIYIDDTTARRATVSVPTAADYCLGTKAAACAPGLGFRICFTAAADDHSGNVGYSPRRCTNMPFDDRSFTRSKASDWTRTTAAGWLGKTASGATKKGAFLATSGNVTVRQLGLVAWKCPACGSVNVYVGSAKVASISLVKSGAGARSLITLPAFAALKTGKVKVVVTSSGKTVKIDGIGMTKYSGLS